MKVAVIGTGVVGSLIARELTKYSNFQVFIFEKDFDIGMGVSKANSAIIHAGYDDKPGTIKAKLCAKGNKMYDLLEKELDIEIKRIGSHVVAFKKDEMNTINELYEQGIKNGVPKMKILDKEEVLRMEPNLNHHVVGSLYAPTAGITEPWQISIAATQNAIKNGAKLHLNEEVTNILTKNNKIEKLITNKSEYEIDLIINASGLYADDIAKMAGDISIPIHPRKGEYVLLNKFTVHDLVKSILFPTPSKMGKGILVLPTVDGGTLLGPTSEDLSYMLKSDRSTTDDGISRIVDNAKHMVPSLDIRETVKIFSGSRPESPNKDFWLGSSEKILGLFHAGAMRSPGLTAAPAIAEYIINEIKDKMQIDLNINKDFDPYFKRIRNYYSQNSLEELDELIKKDPTKGHIVCVCNKITESEVIEAIKRGANTLDGIKFRTRATFGECQGGFCNHKLLKILSRELNLPLEKINNGPENSYVLNGKVRS